MEDGKSSSQVQQQQQQQQQLMMLQHIQRQKDAMSRFPSNIDVHLRPQNHPSLLQHHLRGPQNPNSVTTQLTPNQHPSTPNNNLLQQQQQHQHQQQQQQQQQPQHQKAALQLAYQDAWQVCHPDFKRPFSSIEDACERLLPYHVVADYEAEEDDKILDSDTSGQVFSRSQQWDHNIAAKVSEFTATFEKQVLAFNLISRKRNLGEFRTEEKLMMEQLLLQEEKRALLESRAEIESRQRDIRETHEANMRMAALAHVEKARAESQAHAEMMARAPIRASGIGSRGNSMSMGHDIEQDQDGQPDEIINGWGVNTQRGDDKEPSEDFLNDDETENGDTGLQSEWHGASEFDLNAR